MDPGPSTPLLKHHPRPCLGQSPSILPISAPPPYNLTALLDNTSDSYSRLATRQYDTPNWSASGRDSAVDKRRYKASADALDEAQRRVEASGARLAEARRNHAGNVAGLKFCQEAHDEVAASLGHEIVSSRRTSWRTYGACSSAVLPLRRLSRTMVSLLASFIIRNITAGTIPAWLA